MLIEHECDRHELRLLSKCTNCETPFPIPADWVQGECFYCFLPFATMAKRQKPGQEKRSPTSDINSKRVYK
ncbi:MAG: hypothetical protein RMZ41_022175 [Nostoc sp. DedVER02]|uniref:hypothetical protein n=1 Tax=unclassified Nostoc TaxID=2593658 RepID=UPI002AD3C89E|nr:MULTISPECIES: hypothetical protein [unclassified Nostoc]MDZ7987500.1 hypothetical protein [Nostoc sp. DedVER02]MDZ8112623.1 hypothetical protein [Nostoc sp. DedVER01b]